MYQIHEHIYEQNWISCKYALKANLGTMTLTVVIFQSLFADSITASASWEYVAMRSIIMCGRFCRSSKNILTDLPLFAWKANVRQIRMHRLRVYTILKHKVVSILEYFIYMWVVYFIIPLDVAPSKIKPKAYPGFHFKMCPRGWNSSIHHKEAYKMLYLSNSFILTNIQIHTHRS